MILAVTKRPRRGPWRAIPAASVAPFGAAALSLWVVVAGCSGADSIHSQAPDAGGDGLDAAAPGVDGGGEGGASDSGEPEGGDGSTTDAGGEARSGKLVNHALWKEVEPSADPFDDRPPSVQCPPTAFGEETLGGRFTFYIDSGECAYLTASQSSRVAVEKGDTVTVHYRHFPLIPPAADAGADTQAHLAFMLGTELIADRTIGIPAEEQEYSDSWTATEFFEAGTPVYFHAHNHGDNEYSVLSIEVNGAR